VTAVIAAIVTARSGTGVIISGGAVVIGISTAIGLVGSAVVILAISSGIIVIRSVCSGIPAIAVIRRVVRLAVVIAIIAGIGVTNALVRTISTMVIVVITRLVDWCAVGGWDRGGSGPGFLVVGLRSHVQTPLFCARYFV
jgi:hypothetical protein